MSTGADPTDPSLAPPAPERAAAWRRGASLRLVALGMASGVVVVGLATGSVLYPYVRDDFALDRVVRVVALDWRDFGESRARDRLAYELDHARIGPWVGDETCELRSGEPREVVCSWEVDVMVPGTAWALPLRFGSRSRLTAAGDVR